MAPAKNGKVARKRKRTSKKINRESNQEGKMNWVKCKDHKKKKKEKEDAKMRARKMREKKKLCNQ